MKLTKVFVPLFAVLLLTSCGEPRLEQSDSEEFAPTLEIPEIIQEKILAEEGTLSVDTLKVAIRESDPVQVAAIISGTLPDTCTSIDKIDAVFTNTIFKLKIITSHDTGSNCIHEETKFEEFLLLDVENLPAGNYVVTLDEMSTAFTLEEDYEDTDSSRG